MGTTGVKHEGIQTHAWCCGLDTVFIADEKGMSTMGVKHEGTEVFLGVRPIAGATPGTSLELCLWHLLFIADELSSPDKRGLHQIFTTTISSGPPAWSPSMSPDMPSTSKQT
eukprot:gene21836-28868_t